MRFMLDEWMESKDTGEKKGWENKIIASISYFSASLSGFSPFHLAQGQRRGKKRFSSLAKP